MWTFFKFKKVGSFVALVLLSTLSTACSTFSLSSKKWTTSSSKKAELIQTATLVSPNGQVKEIISNDPRYVDNAPFIKNVIFKKSRGLCNVNTTNENLALRQRELDLELSFLIDSLNSQPVRQTKGGDYNRILSENMLTNLYNTPNCKPYRFKLHIVKSLMEGSSLDQIQESIVR